MHQFVEIDTPTAGTRRQADARHANVLGSGVVRSPLHCLAALPTTEELEPRR
jgi:hypothetical protein